MPAALKVPARTAMCACAAAVCVARPQAVGARDDFCTRSRHSLVRPGISMSDSQTAAAAVRELARTPLRDLHRAPGARMAGFAGYAIPCNIPRASLANISIRMRGRDCSTCHTWGQAILSGPNAARCLETLVPDDVAALAPGRIRNCSITMAIFSMI